MMLKRTWPQWIWFCYYAEKYYFIPIFFFINSLACSAFLVVGPRILFILLHTTVKRIIVRMKQRLVIRSIWTQNELHICEYQARSEKKNSAGNISYAVEKWTTLRVERSKTQKKNAYAECWNSVEMREHREEKKIGFWKFRSPARQLRGQTTRGNKTQLLFVKPDSVFCKNRERGRKRGI